MTMGGQHMGRCERKQEWKAHREGRESDKSDIGWWHGAAHGAWNPREDLHEADEGVGGVDEIAWMRIWGRDCVAG